MLGLELGADDYLSKPFNLRELLARARAVLRRVARSAESPCAERPYLFAGFTLQPQRRRLEATSERVVRLTARNTRCYAPS